MAEAMEQRSTLKFPVDCLQQKAMRKVRHKIAKKGRERERNY